LISKALAERLNRALTDTLTDRGPKLFKNIPQLVGTFSVNLGI
jgi:hypothetical protein